MRRSFGTMPKRRSAKATARIRLLKGGVILTILSFGPAAITACRDGQPEPELEERRTLTDLELGEIGGQIYNEPERAEQILADVDLTPESFEARVRTITDDPERSREYTLGFESVAILTDVRDTLPPDSLALPDTTVVDTAAAPPPPQD
jgi:hypothetical protein